MDVHSVDPLADARWDEFVKLHVHGSIFHHSAWLASLWRTYGYKPLALTTSKPGEPLTNGLVFCQVKSWITGKRLVSLPFSDFCDVLADSQESRARLVGHLHDSLGDDFQYAEVRLTGGEWTPPAGTWTTSEQFFRHVLPLDANEDDLFRNLHKNCIQRKIRRAEKEGLQYVKGRSGPLLHQFYGLLLRTRRRHRIPPQPFEWYSNLLELMRDRLTVHLALKNGQPTAGILTLSHGQTLLYKYGCSDERFNQFGGMPFLFWQVIQAAKAAGMRRLDLGRSEVSNEGLVAFKDRLGAERSSLTNWICCTESTHKLHPMWVAHLGRHMLPRLPAAILHLPESVLAASGGMFYRHMH